MHLFGIYKYIQYSKTIKETMKPFEICNHLADYFYIFVYVDFKTGGSSEFYCFCFAAISYNVRFYSCEL